MTQGRAKRLLLPALCVLGLAMFTSLGVWQIERRAWKLDLIERVNSRVHRAATPLPSSAAPPDAEAIEYRHVKVRGILRHEQETLVEALTERGPGYWVMTPLSSGETTILVNRGFVPPDRADPRTRAAGQVAGPVTIDGLVRLTEPGGRFLRPNRPDEHRWYSRDVGAIAADRHLGPVAPFFIDAGATANPGGSPAGGMTIIGFRNAHLVYALTWFALAGLSLAGLVLVRKGAQEAG